MPLPESYRILFALMAALFAFGLALYLINRVARPVPVVAYFSLEDAISDIKRELQRLEDTPGPRLGLVLSEAKITLQVREDATATTSASLAVPVFDESAVGTSTKSSAQSSSKITVVLVPPDGAQVLSEVGESAIEFADLLVSARAALRRSMDNEPVLDAKSVEVELAFVLVATRSDQASVKARVVSVGVGDEHQLTRSNTVVLKYANPAYRSEGEAKPTVVPP